MTNASEIAAALERVRRVQSGEDPMHVYKSGTRRDCSDCYNLDCQDLAELYIAEHDKTRHMVSYVLTVSRENTDEWMEGLVERVNAWAVAVGESDRVEMHKSGLRIIRGGVRL